MLKDTQIRQQALPNVKDPDEELIRRMRGLGKEAEEAWSEFFKKHWNDVVKVCLKRVGRDAEDVAQEAFFEFFKWVKKSDKEITDSKKLIRVFATRRCAHHLAEKQNKGPFKTGFEMDGFSLPRDPIKQIEDEEMARKILKIAESQLSGRQKDVFMLKHSAGLSNKEIKEGSEIPNVKDFYGGAIKKLRRHVKA